MTVGNQSPFFTVRGVAAYPSVLPNLHGLLVDLFAQLCLAIIPQVPDLNQENSADHLVIRPRKKLR